MNKEEKISRHVTKIVADNGDISYKKAIPYKMNYFYTKLSENIYEQLGVPYVEATYEEVDGKKYLTTPDVIKDATCYKGEDIIGGTQCLSEIKEQLKSFIVSKGISVEQFPDLWEKFLNMIVADIYTVNIDRTGKNWGILVKNGMVSLMPSFDMNKTFWQMSVPMEELAEALENKKNIFDSAKVKLRSNKVLRNAEYIIYATGLYLGDGPEFLPDPEDNLNIQHDVSSTAEYIIDEMGLEKFNNLISKVNMEQAVNKAMNSEELLSIYGLIAQTFNKYTGDRMFLSKKNFSL